MKSTFIIEGMDCANCALKVEKELNKIEGIKQASINFFTNKLVIEFDKEENEEILSQVAKALKKEDSNIKRKI